MGVNKVVISSAGDELLCEVEGAIAVVTFNRPEARNAMTQRMYAGFAEILDELENCTEARVLVLRGAGEKAFVAGTDIAHFRGFSGGEDGIAYEEGITGALRRLQTSPLVSIAAVQGVCVGGGLGIAASCDLRVASPLAKFGVPIARTLGNCLSGPTLQLLVQKLGQAHVARMLLAAELIPAGELAPSGFVTINDDPDAEAARLALQIASYAPLTIKATKMGLSRIAAVPDIDDTDFIRHTYGSDDFAAAVESFLNKSDYKWAGR